MDRLKDRSDVDMDRSEIGPYLGGPRTTSGWPKKTPHPSTSEVRRFLRKRHIRRHGPPQRSDCRRHGPLGDRSLPRKSSDYIRGAKNINAPNPLQPVPKNHPCSLPPNHRVPKQQRDRAGASIEGDQTLPLARSAKALPSSAFSAGAGTVSRRPTHAHTPTPTEPHLTHRSYGFTRA